MHQVAQRVCVEPAHEFVRELEQGAVQASAGGHQRRAPVLAGRAHVCTTARAGRCLILVVFLIYHKHTSHDENAHRARACPHCYPGRHSRRARNYCDPELYARSRRGSVAVHPSSNQSAARTWSNKAPLRHRHRGLLAPANHAWDEVHLAVPVPTVISFVRTSMYTSYCFL